MRDIELKIYDDLDIKINVGRLLINVFYIRYIPAIPNWNVPNHSHSCYELHYIPKGKGVLKINHNKYDIVPGTFYLTGPGVYHEQTTDKYEPMSEYCINFDYSVKKPSSSKDSTPSEEVDMLVQALSEFSFWFGFDEYDNMELFEKIYEELETQLVGYYTSVRNYITQIIINVLRCYLKQKASYIIPLKTLNDNRRQTLDILLYENYKNITMNQMSEILMVSTRQLDRIIKQYYSVSFKEKLLSIRVENALQLLKNTNLRVEEIAVKTGFNHSSYLSRTIKNRTGLSPTGHRHTLKD